MKFHDGTDFTAERCHHINQLFTDKDSPHSIGIALRKQGDYSFRLYLKTYKRDFWSNLGSWQMVFTSDTQLKEKGLDYVKEHQWHRTFKFASWDKDVSLKFVRNDNYWQPGNLTLTKLFT